MTTNEDISSEINADILVALERLENEYKVRDENEADTRHRIIDFILHDMLAWPRNRVSVEEYICPGFADYVLRRSNDDAFIFLEAKKAGIFFELPAAPTEHETYCYIQIGKLISDPNTKAAMLQVRSYCLDTGCEFAGITNGHEWIFFRIFEKDKRWESLQAFVVRSLSFFSKAYTKAYNSFGYTSIIERASLTTLLTSSPPKDRGIYYTKDRIPSYSHTISANRLASTL
jgi:predicted type IV restriction endonuclease